MSQASSKELAVKAQQINQAVLQVESYLVDLDSLFSEYVNEDSMPTRYTRLRKLITEHLNVMRVYALSLRDEMEAM